MVSGGSVQSPHKGTANSTSLKRATLALLALLVAIITLTSAMAEVAPLSGSQLSTAASEFQQLRTINGHFSGGEWNADVDGFGGRKRELMSILKALVGVQGTPFAQVFEAMGAPDVVIPNPSNEAPAATTDLLRTEPTIPTMPGPFLPNSPASVQNESLFLIYYWRGRKDYLWFWIDSDGNVVKSEWHSDFE